MATLGTFDGFHLGHQSIFDALGRQARNLDLPQVAITFHPHDVAVPAEQQPPRRIPSRTFTGAFCEHELRLSFAREDA